MNALDRIPEPTHPATPGKPCPGGGTCCNRPEFDRALHPCSLVNQLQAQLAAERRRADAAEAQARNFSEAIDNVRDALGLESTHWMAIHDEVRDRIASIEAETAERCAEIATSRDTLGSDPSSVEYDIADKIAAAIRQAFNKEKQP